MPPTTPGDDDARAARERRERAAARRARRGTPPPPPAAPPGPAHDHWTTPPIDPGPPWPGEQEHPPADPGRPRPAGRERPSADLDPPWPAGHDQAPPAEPHPAPAWPAQEGETDPVGIQPVTDVPVTDVEERPGRVGEESGSPAVRRVLSAAIAGLAALLTVALLAGTHLDRPAFAAVLLGVQLLTVAAAVLGGQPPGPVVVGVVGALAAVAADAAALLPRQPSLAGLGYVVAGAFIGGIAGQLARGSRRERATESLGATVAVAVGVVAYATLIVLARHPGGTEALTACLVAAGVAVTVARLVDIVLPYPRMAPEVPRGAVGIVLGAMAGTGAAGAAGSVVATLTPMRAAVAGLVTALAAVIADLAVGYADADQRLAGTPRSFWVARHLRGPLAGFALAAPAAYVLSVLVLVRGL